VKWYIKRKPYLLDDSSWEKIRKTGIAVLAGCDKDYHPCILFKVKNLIVED